MSEEEYSDFITREKKETDLIKQYYQALDQLKHPEQCTEGYESLKELLDEEILKQTEFTHIRYGVLQSLGEYLAAKEEENLEQRIINYNHSLNYLNQSFQIKEDMSTLKTMALLARKQGFYFKSVNLYHKALGYAKSATQKLPIMYAIAQLWFIVQHRQQFSTVAKSLLEADYHTIEIQNLQESFEKPISTPFVEDLLQERESTETKLKLNPLHRREHVLCQQPMKTDINLNKRNLGQFINQLLKQLESQMSQASNSNSRKTPDIQCGTSNTEISIKSPKTLGSVRIKKETQQTSSEYEGSIPEKQSLQAVQAPNDPISFDTLIGDILSQWGLLNDCLQCLVTEENSIFHQIFNINLPEMHNKDNSLIGVQNSFHDAPETLSTHQFFEKIEQKGTFFSVVFLFTEIYEHYFEHELYTVQNMEIYGPINLKRNTLQKYLTNSLVQYHQVCNWQEKPFDLLTKLELLYELYKDQKKPMLKSTRQKPQFNALVALIQQMKFCLLHQIDASTLNNDLKMHYLIRYYHIMAQLHSETDFVNPELSKHCIYHLEMCLQAYQGRYQVPWMRQDKITTQGFNHYIENKILIAKSTSEEQILDTLDPLIKGDMINEQELQLSESTLLSLNRALELICQALTTIPGKNTISAIITLLQYLIRKLHEKLQCLTMTKNQMVSFFEREDVSWFLWQLASLLQKTHEYLECNKDIEYVSMFCLKMGIVKLLIQSPNSYHYIKLFHTIKTKDQPKTTNKEDKKKEKDLYKQFNQVWGSFLKNTFRVIH